MIGDDVRGISSMNTGTAHDGKVLRPNLLCSKSLESDNYMTCSHKRVDTEICTADVSAFAKTTDFESIHRGESWTCTESNRTGFGRNHVLTEDNVGTRNTVFFGS